MNSFYIFQQGIFPYFLKIHFVKATLQMHINQIRWDMYKYKNKYLAVIKYKAHLEQKIEIYFQIIYIYNIYI